MLFNVMSEFSVPSSPRHPSPQARKCSCPPLWPSPTPSPTDPVPAGPRTAGRPWTRHLARKLGFLDAQNTRGSHTPSPSPSPLRWVLLGPVCARCAAAMPPRPIAPPRRLAGNNSWRCVQLLLSSSPSPPMLNRIAFCSHLAPSITNAPADPRLRCACGRACVRERQRQTAAE